MANARAIMAAIVSPTARKPKKTSQPPKKRAEDAAWETSQPEIRIGYTAAGRETLEAITAEVTAEFTSDAAGEEPRTQPRAPQVTLPYSDRISNAPGSRQPSTLPADADPEEPAPEISVRHSPAGRETLAAIELELLGGSTPEAAAAPQSARVAKPSPTPVPAAVAAQASPEASVESVEIFEMATFVVRGPDAARLSTDALRRRFVEEHLLHRLPISTSDEIDRVDVTPWTVRGTFVVRVWCRIPPAPAS